MRVWDGMYVVCHQIPRCVMKFKTSYKGFMYVNFSLCIPWVDTCNYHWMVKIILNMRDLGNRMQNQLAPRLAKSTSTGKKSWIEIVFKLYYNASRGVISAQCHKQHFSEYCKGSINTLQGMSIWRDKVLGLNLFRIGVGVEICNSDGSWQNMATTDVITSVIWLVCILQDRKMFLTSSTNVKNNVTQCST